MSKLRQIDEIPLDHVPKVRPARSQDLFNSEIAQFRHKVIAGLNLELGKFNIHNFRLKKPLIYFNMYYKESKFC